MKNITLILLIGQYAQNYYLGDLSQSTITENVKRFKDFLPEYLPLVHPSPRNKVWQKRNPWFESSVIPELQKIINNAII